MSERGDEKNHGEKDGETNHGEKDGETEDIKGQNMKNTRL